MQQNQTIINNQLTNYFVNNNFDPNQKTIIFLHGWRSEAKVWLSVIVELQKKYPDYNYLAIDLPGFGSSPTPSFAFTMKEYAKLVNSLIIKLKLKEIVLVGHSFGGRTAIKLAGEVSDGKDYTISKIVLTGSAGFVDNSNKTNIKQKIAKIAKPVFNLPIISNLKPLVYKSIGADDYNAREDLKEIFKNVINEDLSNQMKRIDAKTLLIFGDKDDSTPVSFGERMNNLIPNSELKVIESTGHFAFLDKPKKWLELVESFLR
jgi:pimeloyl-ACP methyl ester carboxylesterase